MKSSFASRLGDLRTEFETLEPSTLSGHLPDYELCFYQAEKLTRIKTSLARLAIQANCKDKLDGPFCDDVHSLDQDLEEARREQLYNGIQMAKLRNVNIEVVERLVADSGGNVNLIAHIDRIQQLA